MLLLKKKLELIKKFWFCSKTFGININVLLLLKQKLEQIKSFGFVPKFLERSTLGSGTHQNVLVLFWSLASISESLCFRFDFVDITRAPANTLMLLQQSHASATVSRPLVALSGAIQALSLPLQHFYGLYMRSHGLNKHSHGL